MISINTKKERVTGLVISTEELCKKTTDRDMWQSSLERTLDSSKEDSPLVVTDGLTVGSLLYDGQLNDPGC